MQTDCNSQLTFWDIGRQQVTVDFAGGRIVTDAGLLPVRDFERRLAIIAGLAARFPDPRSPRFIQHSAEEILTQQVYQFLGGYFDCNDAKTLRHDPLFLTLAHVPPNKPVSGDEAEAPALASGSTLARFQYAYTRREAQLPIDERLVLFEQRTAQLDRIQLVNEYLIDLFVRTRQERPRFVVVDIDPTDDPTHGQQVLSFYHGYYEQHQYFPLLLFDGDTGFPLGAWLRPGAVHAACGVVGSLDLVVKKLRAVWPHVTILVRGDTGEAVPELYEYCEREGLFYAIGYATNEVLKRRVAGLLWELEVYYAMYQEPRQRFESFEDYQAGSWSRPRRIVAKVEINDQGINRRFVVTNLSGNPRGIYRGFYVKRGAVPEGPIGELKHGLALDRLSAHRFIANDLRLGLQMLAYAIVVLFREATATVPEVARAEVSTLRGTLFKVGASVETSVRRIWFHFSSTWPYRDVFVQVVAALRDFVRRLESRALAVLASPAAEPMAIASG
jgi:Transposase DDE domain group 1